MVMKIENYTGTADTFTWPYNPKVYDDVINSNHEINPIQFQRHHILVSGGGISPKTIVLSGHFSGASKATSYRSLAKHFQQTTQLKKLYFESDKFALGIGKQCKKTNSGGRTNFIDYVATFETIIGILLDDTEATSGTNAGNVTTFITEITGQHNGGGDVVLSDILGNEITIPSSVLTSTPYIRYLLVKMVDSGSGIYVSEYGYVEVSATGTAGTYTQTEAVQTTGGFGVLQLPAGANVSTIKTTNISSAVVKFRNGWSG